MICLTNKNYYNLKTFWFLCVAIAGKPKRMKRDEMRWDEDGDGDGDEVGDLRLLYVYIRISSNLINEMRWDEMT